MKRKTLQLALMGAAAVAAALPATAQFSWKKFSGQEVNVMLPEHPITDGVRGALSQFEKDTGLKVNLNTMAEDLYFDRMEVALRGNKGSADVYLLPMDSTAYTQYRAGLIHSLSPFIDDASMTDPGYDIGDFPSGFLDTTRYPGGPGSEYYGIPASFEVYVLFYNKDLVNKYLGGKVPETMPELIKAAAKIKKDSGGKVAGAVMRGVRSDTLIDTISGVVFNSWGNPGDVEAPYGLWFDGDWSKPRLTESKIVRGLTDYAGLMQAGPVNIQSIDWPDAEQVFKQQRAAFFIDASLFAPGFEAGDSPISGKIGYRLIPPHRPGEPSYTAHWGWGLGIPANAANPGAGWFFIQYMTNKTNDPVIGKLHWGSVRESTNSNPSYRRALNPEYAKVVGEAVKTSKTSVVFRENFSELALAVVDAIQSIYGGSTPEAAAAKAQATFKDKAK